MKKIAKLSLVAAVAVAGMTSASAASLENAIKNVDVSGQFRYRLQNKDVDGGDSTTSTDVEVEVGVKVPVTDTVTAVFKIDNANDDTNDVTKGEVKIEDYYFSYNKDNVTVNFGQQNIPGRMTDGEQGDGLVALTKLGSFTVGGAYFVTNGITKADDVASVIAMGNVGPVSLLAQYADVENVTGAYNVKADAKLGMASVGVEYTEQDMDANDGDYSTTKVWAAAKAGAVSGSLAYAMTADDGSGSIDGALETASEAMLWNLGTGTNAVKGVTLSDLSAVIANVNFAVNSKVSLRAGILDGDAKIDGKDSDLQEVLGQVSYKAAKNLNTYFRYATVEAGATEFDRARVEVKYSF